MLALFVFWRDHFGRFVETEVEEAKSGGLFLAPGRVLCISSGQRHPRWPSTTPSSGRDLWLMAQRRHSGPWSEPSEPPEPCVCAPNFNACQVPRVRVGLVWPSLGHVYTAGRQPSLWRPDEGIGSDSCQAPWNLTVLYQGFLAALWTH